ncbi:hypothetical protein BDZ89DRAFT_1046481 [Hymenopellis radicata]|nr:hypothetical protein BDZ89DRAFT_1046481 [Hymenopellis radicata]
MPPNPTEFWIGLPPFLFLVKGGSRPTYYAQTHTTLVNLARLYTDGPSTADGETVEVRQYEHCQKLHRIMTDKTFRANVHRLQQGSPFTLQRSDTKVWVELRAKSETWGSDEPGSLKEMKAAAERSIRERYRSPSPARSYIIISSDEEQDEDRTQNQGLHVRRTPYIKREPSHEVELLATPSPTPARSRNVTTNARTVRSQSRTVNRTSSVRSVLPSRIPTLRSSNATAASTRRPHTIKAEPRDHVLPSPSHAVSNARREVQVLIPAFAKTLVGARKRSNAGLGHTKSEAMQPAIAHNSAVSGNAAANPPPCQPRAPFNNHSGLFSSTHRSEAKRRRGRSISSETSADTPPPTRLRTSQDPPKTSVSTKTQARAQTTLSELSALTESSRASVESDSLDSGVSDSDLPVNYADLPVSALLNCGVHGKSLYKILLGRRKEQATTPCGQCVKKGKTCFIGRYSKRGRPSKICIFCVHWVPESMAGVTINEVTTKLTMP